MKRLFGNRIKPACRYCRVGFPSPDTDWILCPKRGAVPPDHSCRHYGYDPILRIPKPPLSLERFDKEEFSL